MFRQVSVLELTLKECLQIAIDKANDLERENSRLQNMVDSLTERLESQGEDKQVVRLLDAVASMADLYRTKYDTLPPMTKYVIDAYDRLQE